MVHMSRNAEVKKRRGDGAGGGGHLPNKRCALLEIGGNSEQLGLLDSGERAAHAAVVQPELWVAADCWHWELHAWNAFCRVLMPD